MIIKLTKQQADWSFCEMMVYEYGVEFTQYDEYEGREISERIKLYFKFVPDASDIRGRLFNEGYDVCQLLDYVLIDKIQD